MRRLGFAFFLLIAAGCTDVRSYAQAICVVVDVSGTYADQKPEVVQIIKVGLLPKIRPGDSFILVRIDDQSYNKRNVEVSTTLDTQPSHANAQKLQIAHVLDEFAKSHTHARYTDIRGAMMMGAEYLRETGAGKKAIVIFSDLLEELPKGVHRKFAADEFSGMRIFAMNVKRLAYDNADPEVYRKRLKDWEAQVKSVGAIDWHVVLDAEALIEALYEGR
jgi:hypothetical protein